MDTIYSSAVDLYEPERQDRWQSSGIVVHMQINFILLEISLIESKMHVKIPKQKPFWFWFPFLSEA